MAPNYLIALPPTTQPNPQHAAALNYIIPNQGTLMTPQQQQFLIQQHANANATAQGHYPPLQYPNFSAGMSNPQLQQSVQLQNAGQTAQVPGNPQMHVQMPNPAYMYNMATYSGMPGNLANFQTRGFQQ
jgi:hypothetical protein